MSQYNFKATPAPRHCTDYYNLPNNIYVPLTIHSNTNKSIEPTDKRNSLRDIAQIIHRRVASQQLQHQRSNSIHNNDTHKISAKQRFRCLILQALYQYRQQHAVQHNINNTNNRYKMDMATVVMHANILFRNSLLKSQADINVYGSNTLHTYLEKRRISTIHMSKHRDVNELLAAKRLFDMLDTDQSGTIDVYEIKAAYDRLSIDISLHDIQYRLSCVDSNQNNVIDWHEFILGFNEAADWTALYELQQQSTVPRLQIPFSLIIPATYRKQYIDTMVTKYSAHYTFTDGYKTMRDARDSYNQTREANTVVAQQQNPTDTRTTDNNENTPHTTAKFTTRYKRISYDTTDTRSTTRKYKVKPYWGSKQVLLSTVNQYKYQNSRHYRNNTISHIQPSIHLSSNAISSDVSSSNHNEERKQLDSSQHDTVHNINLLRQPTQHRYSMSQDVIYDNAKINVSRPNTSDTQRPVTADTVPTNALTVRHNSVYRDTHYMRDNDPLIRICRSGKWYKILVNIQSQQFTTPDDMHIYVNRRDRNGSTVLYHAVWYGHLHCVQVLCSNTSIDINARNNRNNTALHLACEKHYTDIITILLQHNAVIDIMNVTHQTCMDMIYVNKDKTVAECNELAQYIHTLYNQQYTTQQQQATVPCMESTLGIASVVDEVVQDSRAPIIPTDVSNHTVQSKHVQKQKLNKTHLLSSPHHRLNTNKTTKNNAAKLSLRPSTLTLTDVQQLQVEHDQSIHTTNIHTEKQHLTNIRLQLASQSLNTLFQQTLQNVQHGYINNGT